MRQSWSVFDTRARSETGSNNDRMKAGRPSFTSSVLSIARTGNGNNGRKIRGRNHR